MKIVASADWRDSVPFENPVLLADVVPGEPTRCFSCGPDSALLPRTELWAYKHRHPKNHDGYVRFYCAVHVPKVQRRSEPVTPAARAKSSAGSPQRRAPKPVVPERVRAMCPNCFIEVSATGECGNCGWTAD